MSDISFLNSILLVTPYLLCLVIFYYFNQDKFFLRKKAHQKIDIYISFVLITCVLFLTWNSIFYEYLFLGLKVSKEDILFDDKLIAFLGICLAVVGWLYTTRSQLLTSMKSHSIQTIMNARLSDCYNQKFDRIYVILKDHKTLSLQHYETLSTEEKSIVHYILNYYEFIAISIRFNETDEEIIKSMTRSQVIQTYKTFEEVILDLHSQSGTHFENFIALYNRWNTSEQYQILEDQINSLEAA